MYYLPPMLLSKQTQCTTLQQKAEANPNKARSWKAQQKIHIRKECEKCKTLKYCTGNGLLFKLAKSGHANLSIAFIKTIGARKNGRDEDTRQR